MARIVGFNPYSGHPGASVLFLARAPSSTQRRRIKMAVFATGKPIVRGKTVYFLYPVRVEGKRTPLDLERFLGVAGTARSARVVVSVLERMNGRPNLAGK
jgi:hypothetical protein